MSSAFKKKIKTKKKISAHKKATKHSPKKHSKKKGISKEESIRLEDTEEPRSNETPTKIGIRKSRGCIVDENGYLDLDTTRLRSLLCRREK